MPRDARRGACLPPPTFSHLLPPPPTLSHLIPPSATFSHLLSPSLTVSRRLSPSLTVSHLSRLLSPSLAGRRASCPAAARAAALACERDGCARARAPPLPLFTPLGLLRGLGTSAGSNPGPALLPCSSAALLLLCSAALLLRPPVLDCPGWQARCSSRRSRSVWASPLYSCRYCTWPCAHRFRCRRRRRCGRPPAAGWAAEAMALGWLLAPARRLFGRRPAPGGGAAVGTEVPPTVYGTSGAGRRGLVPRLLARFGHTAARRHGVGGRACVRLSTGSVSCCGSLHRPAGAWTVPSTLVYIRMASRGPVYRRALRRQGGWTQRWRARDREQTRKLQSERSSSERCRCRLAV